MKTLAHYNVTTCDLDKAETEQDYYHCLALEKLEEGRRDNLKGLIDNYYLYTSMSNDERNAWQLAIEELQTIRGQLKAEQYEPLLLINFQVKYNDARAFKKHQPLTSILDILNNMIANG